MVTLQMFRTYEPSTGRYLEPDPIGLRGCENLFAYVAGNPLNYIDDFGLQASCPCNCGTEKRCQGTARALAGNEQLVGLPGGFSTRYPDVPVPVRKGTAAVDPRQFGGAGKQQLRPYLGRICGSNTSLIVFDGVTDVIGGRTPRNPCGATNVREALKCLYPNTFIVEVPGNPDLGIMPIELVIPRELACPTGTEEVPCS